MVALNTGVTNAVKRFTVTDAAGRRRTAVLQLPHVRPVVYPLPASELTANPNLVQNPGY